MKRYAITTVIIMTVLTALIITMMAVNNRSQKELEEIDKFIAAYDKEQEIYTVFLEAETEEKVEIAIQSNTVRRLADNTIDVVPVTETAEALPEVTDEILLEGAQYESAVTWSEDTDSRDRDIYSDGMGSVPADVPDTDDQGSGPVLTPEAGVVWFNGHMETYYNLPMGGVLDIMYALGFQGDYWVRDDGCKMFGDYIMVAADFNWLPRGSVVLTSRGWGMVCDTGEGGTEWLDLAVTW